MWLLCTLVEPERDVQRRGAALAVHAATRSSNSCSALEGQVADAALEEIAGEGALRRDDEPGRRGQQRRFPEYLPQPGKILRVSTLPGPELGQRDSQHR